MTSFKLYSDGTVRCSCDSIDGFSKDLEKFIVPILEYSIKAEFFGKSVIIYSHDNANSIAKRLVRAMRE